MATAVIIAALFSSLIVETGAEIVIRNYFLDFDSGALIETVPGNSTQMVNLLPQATIPWESL
ncbi:hypothetical protein OAI08_04455 [Gammaproteobacteria bacterium]|jgi:predicted Ser/Thr protein kinase|nr:hypothetical protein [Betaproteobacteria bacterium]MDB4826117.1 hypothetical protein [Gammaproteobacteria bacterium]